MNPRRPNSTVSVVIAAYNSGRWLGETLDRVLAQTYPAAEVIVVDDGSSDDTAAVIRSYGQRVRALHLAHSGQPASRNAGVRTAIGEFIAFCDADDIWNPRKLESQIGLAMNRNLAWVICDAGWMRQDGTPAQIKMPPLCEGDVLKPLFMGNFIKSATPLVRKEVFAQVGEFNEAATARIGEDWDMWLRIAARYPLGVVYENLATIRLHDDSMLASSTSNERVHGLAGVIERAAIREPARLGPLRKAALAAIWHQAGVSSYRARQLEEGDGYFRKELQLRPWQVEARMYRLLCRLGPGPVKAVDRFRKHLW